MVIYWKKNRLRRGTMGKLTYAKMKKQLRALHDCVANDSGSVEDAKVKFEASYSDDKEDTRERDVFYSNSSKKGGTIVEIIEAFIREVVVIVQEEKQKKWKMEEPFR